MSRLLGVLLVAIGAAALLFEWQRGADPQAAEPIVLASGALKVHSTAAGQAVLSVENMSPGDSAGGEAVVSNEGDVGGLLVLRQRRRSQGAGTEGGFLFKRLDLEVRERGGPLIFDGQIGALTPSGLGRFASAASRTYDFRATLPAGAGNELQLASLSVDFHWTTDTKGVVQGISCPYGRIGTGQNESVPDTSQADRLLAKGGDDELDGGAGTDCLFGGDGEDSLSGGGAMDELRGGRGDDDLNGGAGPDRLRGRQGDDELTGGPGRDLLRATGGADTVFARDGEVDSIRCGSGFDIAFTDPADNVRGCERTSGGGGG